MSSHSRSSSHAPSRLSLSTSQRPSSHQREQRQLSTGSPIPGASPVPVSHKRRSEHGPPEDVKRRRQDTSLFATDELLKPSIVVRAQPPNPLSRPYTLFPIMLLPREHLPLSYLDLAAPSGDLPPSRRFQSHIRILDLEGRLGSNVLLARSPSNSSGSGSGFSSASSVFAIERDESGFYTLCKLGSWVDLDTLSQHATAVCQQRMLAKPSVLSASTGQGHALITPRMYKEQGKKRLVIAELQSIVRRRPAASQLTPEATVGSQADTSLACDDLLVPFMDVEGATGSFQAVEETQERSDDLPGQPSSQTVLQVAPLTAKLTALPTPPASDATKQSSMEPSDATATIKLPEPPGPPTADDIFQNIRSQYFEALYHSLVSFDNRIY
ncbi:hypothetical protein SEPCBS57363_002916 [Sporothrix epigloea]|uniref:Uncharacterized protein n=1 Tax=Sporothrix epigloea TaxID=1892477 RepID=A0ABP0DIJ3_9PEZI